MAIESMEVSLGSLLPWFEVNPISGDGWDGLGVHGGDGLDISDLSSDRGLNTSKVPKNQPVLVVFLCNHSPYVRPIEKSLGTLIARYREELFAVGICSNDEKAYPSDDVASLKAQAERAGFTFPYCQDVEQRAARAFEASCTPEFFVYDRNHRLAYHGQYDSSRPVNDVPTTGANLKAAIDHVLASEVLLEDQLRSYGCSIKWTAGNYPIYLYTANS